MSKIELLAGLHKDFESIKKIDKNGVEYWEARELMPLLGYKEWRKFEGAIQRAKDACGTSSQEVADHFVGADKMIKIARGTKKEAFRKIEDYRLSRYACYLIAQNGDPRKVEIAMAQTYFAVQTRKQEIFQELDQDQKRLFIRGEVKTHNKKLFDTAKKAGVSNFGKFNNYGYLGLYGLTVEEIKKKKEIGKDDVLDRAGATELAANLFRITQTDDKIIKEELFGEEPANATHFEVGRKVRNTIKDIGGTMPEELKAERHIKELEKARKKRLKSGLRKKINIKKK
ncbi:MAG: DNA damage-inducible protein D [Candidatus Moranbacteria bacterium]|nr:DNA damage-inducible protein D [Candidatus Moranbacteria bacterium]